MRRGKTYRGFYVNRDKRNVHNVFNGRTGKNMSYAKVEEYSELLWYLHFGEFNQYGWLVPIHRLQKNLKYRKKFIKEWEARKEKFVYA